MVESNNQITKQASNVYVHFPFCRNKCAYCALHSRIGKSESERFSYFLQVIAELRSRIIAEKREISTIYFGGGSPCFSIFAQLSEAVFADELWRKIVDSGAEFTVELHPLDVEPRVLEGLKRLGVNRISMGVQSLDDAVLKSMGRGYSADFAIEKFSLVKRYFDNAGIDLIVGYPSASGVCPQQSGGVCPQQSDGVCPQSCGVCPQRSDGVCPQGGAGDLLERKWEKLRDFVGLRHCSVYSLILEEKSRLGKLWRDGKAAVPSDDEALDELRIVGGILSGMGLERYEISSWAKPGFECCHNSAVWSGEDYFGIGDGAYGRVGLTRTRGVAAEGGGWRYEVEEVDEASDCKERLLFQLRTRRGLSPATIRGLSPVRGLSPDGARGLSPVRGLSPEDCGRWIAVMERFVGEGLLERMEDGRFRLTERGTEVCDTILAELV